MDDPEVCHVLLIFVCMLLLLVPAEAQFFLVILFISPCVWYARVAYQRHMESQAAGLWRERIRGVRG